MLAFGEPHSKRHVFTVVFDGEEAFYFCLHDTSMLSFDVLPQIQLFTGRKPKP